MKQMIYSLMTGIHRKCGLKKIRKLEHDYPSMQSRINVPFVYRGRGYFKKIEPRQNRFEIESLYQAICDLSPERVLEIGTARGGTLYLWSQAATDDAIIVSVDLPGGEFGGAYLECRTPFYEAFARAEQKLTLLRSDSHEKQTLEKVQNLFVSKPIDFAFIDGDHTYEGVKADFQLYGPLVRPGGLIGFHDILLRTDLPEIQVDRFWKEISKRYDSMEFIDPDDSGRKRAGIGLIRVGESGIQV